MKIKKGLKLLFGIIIFLFLLMNVKDILELKTSKERFGQFFEDPDKYDVLVLGTSHAMTAVAPLEMWDSYGISSYNFANGDTFLPVSYWILMNTLDYTTPELVVIDCNSFSNNYKYSHGKMHIHSSFDEFPLSANKVRMALDIFKNDKYKQQDKITGIQLLWNLLIYHNRWEELTVNDFKTNLYSTSGGVQIYHDVSVDVMKEYVGGEKVFDEYFLGEDYLKKIINECKKRNIEVLLTYMPGSLSNESWIMEANTVKRIALEQNVNYINFYELNIVDATTDFVIDGDHLNVSGARKITDYLGKYIRDNYDNVSKNKHDLSEDYKGLLFWEKQNLEFNKELEKDLIVLSDNKFKMFIEFKNEEIFNSEYYNKFFANIGIDIERITDNTNLIVIEKDKMNIQYYENKCLENNYNEINVVECNNNKPDGDIRITTYDTEEEWVIKVQDYYPYMVEDKIRYKEQ